MKLLVLLSPASGVWRSNSLIRLTRIRTGLGMQLVVGLLLLGLTAACGDSSTSISGANSTSRGTPKGQSASQLSPDTISGPPSASTEPPSGIPASGPVALEEVGRLDFELRSSIGPVAVGEIGGTPYAFIGTDRFVSIVDLTSLETPRTVEQIDTPNPAQGLFLSGDRLYVVVEVRDHLRVIDVSDPAAPRELGVVAIAGGGSDVAVQGDYAFVASRSDGLRVIDVSDPAAPKEVGFVRTPSGADGVFVQGNYAFVADPSAGLRVIDISNPAAPKEVASVSSWEPGEVNPAKQFGPYASALDVFVRGDYAFVAAGNDGLQIIDVSDPLSPKKVSSLSGAGPGTTVSPEVEAVFVQGNYAFVVMSQSGLGALDVSNPAAPQAAGLLEIAEPAKDVFVHGEYALVTYGFTSEGTGGTPVYGGLRIVRISAAGGRSASTPSPVGASMPGPIDLEIAGRLVMGPTGAVVAGRIGGAPYAAIVTQGLISIVDLSSPETPKIVGQINTIYGSVEKLFLSGEHLYAGHVGGRFQVFDVSNPASPKESGSVQLTGSVQGISVQGEYAFVAAFTEGLRVLDVSAPDAPEEVGSVPIPGQAFGVFVQGNYAYVAAGPAGLHVIDVSKPSGPREVGFGVAPTLTDGYYGVSVEGSYAFVASGRDGLHVIDISNPEILNQVGFLGFFEGANSVLVQEGRAFILDQHESLRIIDVSNPAAPKEVDLVEMKEAAKGVYVQDELVLLTAGGAEGGLLVLRASGHP
jgi:hypothetical protein